jgi:uncharacterized alpha/beta hydrolase family protein
MTDKIVNIFNKQPVETTLDRGELNEVIDDLSQRRDSVDEVLVITIDKDDEMLVRTGNMSRETAYFILGLAQLNALTQ